MKKHFLFGALAVAAVAIVACTGQAEQKPQGLVIEKQGVFSSGGRVTEAIPGEYDPTQNWLDRERKGTTTHVDHANTFYQIPAGENGNPIVFLHGYGQTRTGWQSTPDGREGWSDIFLKKGYSVFLVDQPRRGAAGATEKLSTTRAMWLTESSRWANRLGTPTSASVAWLLSAMRVRSSPRAMRL